MSDRYVDRRAGDRWASEGGGAGQPAPLIAERGRRLRDAFSPLFLVIRVGFVASVFMVQML